MNFKELIQKNRDEWNSHISPEIRALVDRPERVTLAEWKDLRMNSWEHEEVAKRLDTEALIHATQHTLDNCQPDRDRPSIVYDDALAVLFVPLLLERLREVMKAAGAR